MKYFLILTAALFAFPAVAVEGRDHCSLRDLDGSWIYYSFAPSDNYAMTCSLQISSGTINRGSCVQSGVQNFASSGSLSFAASTHHQDRHGQKLPKSADQSACSITGTIRISYPGINRTETLTNLTIADDKDEIVGVGSNSFHLISVNFVRSGDDDNGKGNGGGDH